MTTHAAVRQRLVERYGLGLFIANGDIGAIATGTITSVLWLRDGTGGTDKWYGRPVYRPGNATGVADDIRYATTVTSAGVLSVDANWADSTLGTETAYILNKDLHPRWLRDAIQRMQEKTPARVMIPISLAADASQRASDATAWGTAVNASAAKTTTAARIFIGNRAMEITNSGANGYLPTTDIGVDENKRIIYSALGRIHSGGGSAQMTAFDVSNSAVFGTTVAHPSTRYQWMSREETIPDNCHNINIRLGSTGATDVTNWGPLWVIQHQDGLVRLPTLVAEAWEIEAIVCYRFDNLTAPDCYSARSLEQVEIPREAWDVQSTLADANQMAVQFHDRSWLRYPLMAMCRIPDSDTGALVSAEADVINVPLVLAAAKAATELFEAHPELGIDGRKRLADDDLKAATGIRTQRGPAQRREPAGYVTLAN